MSNETFYEEPQLINSLVSFDQDVDGKNLYINQTQEITDDFLQAQADKRLASTNERASDFYEVASIPIAVVDHLLTHYGFDVMTAPVRDTLRMLKQLELDQFLSTQKRI
jgi:hypothetical protein